MRKFIPLPPLINYLTDLSADFIDNATVTSSSQSQQIQQLCKICNKQFISKKWYIKHLNSTKHLHKKKIFIEDTFLTAHSSEDEKGVISKRVRQQSQNFKLLEPACKKKIKATQALEFQLQTSYPKQNPKIQKHIDRNDEKTIQNTINQTKEFIRKMKSQTLNS